MTSDTENRTKDEIETEAATEAAARPEASADRPASPFERGGYSDDDAEAFIQSVAADRIAGLEAENAELKDRMLRLAADMENLRRRTERELKDARVYGVTGFAREMLAVMDNLRRAIEAVPADAREAGADTGLTTLIDGVELTERAMLATLEKFGVKKLEPEGQRFDPNFHQAMFEIPNADVANNTVLQVVQDGYAIGDRVLRPALVGVSKGGPKMAAEAKPAAEGDAA
ncbi:molecular chaperone GrpE [Aureimonas sp. Leaf454]|uniref:nucleotide exchange factor GrpE n=1 Tax=Aureimonas sp. Leaf454 TaxID=1736381 RepID=UPI0006FF4D03|nr:nucleotide exchange factor GrpE [Aureimonas sp. Leaf454]KQT46198.1 molecular chaperone GrpE [Aureimonas sp. Leaf454]